MVNKEYYTRNEFLKAVQRLFPDCKILQMDDGELVIKTNYFSVQEHENRFYHKDSCNTVANVPAKRSSPIEVEHWTPSESIVETDSYGKTRLKGLNFG